MFLNSFNQQSESSNSNSESRNSNSESKNSGTESRNNVSESKNSVSESRNSVSESRNSVSESRNSVSESRNSVSESRNSVSESRNSVSESINSVSESRNSVSESINSDSESSNHTSESGKHNSGNGEQTSISTKRNPKLRKRYQQGKKAKDRDEDNLREMASDSVLNHQLAKIYLQGPIFDKTQVDSYIDNSFKVRNQMWDSFLKWDRKWGNRKRDYRPRKPTQHPECRDTVRGHKDKGTTRCRAKHPCSLKKCCVGTVSLQRNERKSDWVKDICSRMLIG